MSLWRPRAGAWATFPKSVGRCCKMPAPRDAGGPRVLAAPMGLRLKFAVSPPCSGSAGGSAPAPCPSQLSPVPSSCHRARGGEARSWPPHFPAPMLWVGAPCRCQAQRSAGSPAPLPVAGERQEEKKGWEQQAGRGLKSCPEPSLELVLKTVTRTSLPQLVPSHGGALHLPCPSWVLETEQEKKIKKSSKRIREGKRRS